MVVCVTHVYFKVVSSSWKSDELRDGSANNQVCGRYSDVESTCVLKQQHHGKGE